MAIFVRRIKFVGCGAFHSITRQIDTMKFIHLLLVCCLFGFPQFLSGKHPEKRHLFVEWRHWDSTIVLGALEGRKFKRKTQFACALRELKPADVSNWLGEPGGGVLLYFHAMWGQQPNFQRKCLRSVEAALRYQPDTGIQTVVSFIWHAGGVIYPLNWQKSSERGEPLASFIHWMAGHYRGRTNILCHSMGNRFFEGTLRKMPLPPDGDTLFNTVILFSPDLDAAADDPDFLRLCQSAQKVVVFVHRHDRLLLLSSWALGRERLGRSGPKGKVANWPEQGRLSVVDMTGRVRGLQNHTHLDKKWVQERMQEVLK